MQHKNRNCEFHMTSVDKIEAVETISSGDVISIFLKSFKVMMILHVKEMHTFAISYNILHRIPN